MWFATEVGRDRSIRFRDPERRVRSFQFIVIFALFWITTNPFIDLRNPDVLLASEDGNALQQFSVLLLVAMAALFLAKRRETALLGFSPALIGILAWQVLSVVTSTHPDLSIRRFILSTCVTGITLAWVLLPRNAEHFSRLLTGACLGVLAIAYFGVIFMPAVSIHNLDEVLELVNAGGWRGHFAHKNIAGAAMVFLIIYGLYVAKHQGRAVSAAIVVLAMIFLYNSDNKTSIGLVVFTLALSAVASRTRSLLLKVLLVLAPIACMNLVTVGSVIFDPIQSLVASVSSDPTFTNRVDVWRFGLGKLAERPLLGYGYEAFWATSDLINGGYKIEGWAATAGHAHNGYLNIALSMGIPGMLLVVFWTVWEPLRDYHRGQAGSNDPEIGLMYLRIWIFAMFYASLESPFFASRGPIWFSILGAMFGLRYHALAVQVADRSKPAEATTQAPQQVPALST